MNNKKWIWIGMVVLFIMALLVGILSDVKKDDNAIRGGTDYVAVIRIDGAIVGGPRNDVLFGASGMTTSEQLMYEMEKARKDNRAKAVLIRINSPGGSTGATQEIAEEMDKIKSAGKPIIISMGDTCASAGYWIASKGDYIFANPATLTGSIGVYMEYTNVEELMNKLGIHSEKIKSGEHKDIMSMYRPMTPEENQMIQQMVDDIYAQFISTVADGRQMDIEKVKKIADGRILTGKQAMDLGLVDAMGNYYDALSYAGGRAGLDGETIPTKKYTSGSSLREIFYSETERMVQVFSKEMVTQMVNSLDAKEKVVIR